MQDSRVLVLATTFPRWRGDREPAFVFELCRQLADKVSLWVLVPHAPSAKAYEEIDGVRIVRFPYFFPRPLQTLCYEGGILPKLKSSWLARLQLPFFLTAQCFFLWKTARRHKIDFIHCHWIVPQGFFAALYNFFTGVPFMLTAHGGDVFSLQNNPFISRLKKFTVQRSQICTANSEATRKAVSGICNRSRIRTIPMGVDTQLFHPGRSNPALRDDLGQPDLFLLGVGRFAEKKGFPYLIRALPNILEQHPKTKLALIGFGPQEDELKQLAREMGVADSVLFPGSRTGGELAEYFATADIFIGPSIVTESGDTEGLGVVFLEAMASGTAVIASNVGGIRDIVEDGVTGLLVPQKDPTAIAVKVISLAGNPELKAKLAGNGHRKVEEYFSWPTVGKAFLETYREILEEHN
ncbi:hypothetical protein UZ36_01355 [Candidatus Nitromaritima sp. SCGC AAA799-C22]|nr:hypothetical protein UZ36_01355 [Candidatus Nitromaritima sp. SCGC AAA799-C22]